MVESDMRSPFLYFLSLDMLILIQSTQCLPLKGMIKLIVDNNFNIKDLGILKYFLGLDSKESIVVSQRK